MIHRVSWYGYMSTSRSHFPMTETVSLFSVMLFVSLFSGNREYTQQLPQTRTDKENRKGIEKRDHTSSGLQMNM